MKNNLPAKIKAMKIGHMLPLADDNERRQALAIARTLRRAGVISFQITTKPLGKGGFSAMAVPE